MRPPETGVAGAARHLARVVGPGALPTGVWRLAIAPIESAARSAFDALGLACDGSAGGAATIAGRLEDLQRAARADGPARSCAEAALRAIAGWTKDRFLLPGPQPLELREPVVMAVVNVTPDSFSDGGLLAGPDAAAAAALDAFANGARIVDLGGESTRPGAPAVAADEEVRRVLPALERIRERAPNAYVSVDTTKAEVARRALAAGARMVNDVSGLAADPGLAEVVAEAGVPVVLGHRRGDPATMQSMAEYEDVVAEVARELDDAVRRATRAGIDEACILLDPGLGFAKRPAHGWEILRRLGELRSAGFPLVVGPSRKSFLGEILPGRPPADRDGATAVCVALAALAGAKVHRVHAVRPACDALAVARAIETIHP